MKLKEKLRALLQLQDEEMNMCKIYKKCNDCPNLLAGGYCEVRLAISKLNDEISASYNKKENNRKIKTKEVTL